MPNTPPLQLGQVFWQDDFTVSEQTWHQLTETTPLAPPPTTHPWNIQEQLQPVAQEAPMEYEYVTTKDFLLRGDDQRYDNPSDAARRLMGSFIRFEGEFIYVIDMTPGMKMTVKRSNGSHFTVSANDSRLDISSAPLGYVNVDNVAYYVSRAPTRQQQQGVSIGRTTFLSIRNFQETMHPNMTRTVPAFFDLFEKRFPKLSEYKGESMAFSRTWALSRIGKDMSLLVHRTEPVGFYHQKAKKFRFRKREFTRKRLFSLENILSKQNGEHYELELPKN